MRPPAQGQGGQHGDAPGPGLALSPVTTEGRGDAELDLYRRDSNLMQ